MKGPNWIGTCSRAFVPQGKPVPGRGAGCPFPAVLRVLTGRRVRGWTGRRLAAPRDETVGRMRRSGCVSAMMLVISGLAAGIAPAAAQFGGIFGDPPRPPSNVPSQPPIQDDRFPQPVYPQNPQPVPPAPPQV